MEPHKIVWLTASGKENIAVALIAHAAKNDRRQKRWRAVPTMFRVDDVRERRNQTASNLRFVSRERQVE